MCGNKGGALRPPGLEASCIVGQCLVALLSGSLRRRALVGQRQAGGMTHVARLSPVISIPCRVIDQRCEMGEWLPIEAAPRDGMAFIGARFDEQGMIFCGAGFSETPEDHRPFIDHGLGHCRLTDRPRDDNLGQVSYIGRRD